MRVLYILSILFLFNSVNVATASNCYKEETVTMPDVFICDKDQSNSADFTNGCRRTTINVTQKVSVECKKMWMPTPDSWVLPWAYNRPHDPSVPDDVCEFYGMEKSDFDGVVCSSYTLRPRSGANLQSINHNLFKRSRQQALYDAEITNQGGRYIILPEGQPRRHPPICGLTNTYYDQNARIYQFTEPTGMVCEEKGKVD